MHMKNKKLSEKAKKRPRSKNGRFVASVGGSRPVSKKPKGGPVKV